MSSNLIAGSTVCLLAQIILLILFEEAKLDVKGKI